MKTLFAISACVALVVAAAHAAPTELEEIDDTFVLREMEEYIIQDALAAANAYIAELKRKIAELRLEMQAAFSERRKVIVEQLAEAKKELDSAIAELKRSLKELFGRDAETYMAALNDVDDDDATLEESAEDAVAYATSRMDGLNNRMREIIEQLKVAFAERREVLMKELTEARDELKKAFAELQQRLKEIFKRDTNTYAADA